MIIKYQKEQTVTRLKKAYSTLATAINKSIAEYGPISTWNYTDRASVVTQYIMPNLKIIKRCGCDGEEICNFNYKKLNSTEITGLNNCVSLRFFLTDGTFIGIPHGPVAGNADGSIPFTIYVDINGKNKPNVLGKDVFMLMIYLKNSNSSKPYAEKLNPYIWGPSSWCTKDSDGTCCTRKIFEDGFQIKDDYPW